MSQLQRGSRVTTGTTPLGTVVDLDSNAQEALVQYDTGSLMETLHGRWHPMASLTVTGHDPDALVYTPTGGRRVAGPA